MRILQNLVRHRIQKITMNPKQIKKKSILRYVKMKLQHIKDKGEIIKINRQKRLIIYKGMIISLTADFSTAMTEII